MKSMADGLPDWVRSQVSPEWFENERGYWAARDALLAEYAGQWVAFAGGRVVAAGRSPSGVSWAAREAGGALAFVICCGAEETPHARYRSNRRVGDVLYPRPGPMPIADGAPGRRPRPDEAQGVALG